MALSSSILVWVSGVVHGTSHLVLVLKCADQVVFFIPLVNEATNRTCNVYVKSEQTPKVHRQVYLDITKHKQVRMQTTVPEHP